MTCARGDDDKQPVYIMYNARGIMYIYIIIYTDCYYSGVVVGVKRFRVIALQFCECVCANELLPSFYRSRSTPPPSFVVVVYIPPSGDRESDGWMRGTENRQGSSVSRV